MKKKLIINWRFVKQSLFYYNLKILIHVLCVPLLHTVYIYWQLTICFVIQYIHKFSINIVFVSCVLLYYYNMLGRYTQLHNRLQEIIKFNNIYRMEITQCKYIIIKLNNNINYYMVKKQYYTYKTYCLVHGQLCSKTGVDFNKNKILIIAIN